MFRRRDRPSFLTRARNFVWPRSGWVRWAQYHSHRVGRMKDSSYKVAAGLACGVAVSFTPFIGFHLMLAATIAYIIRANILAALVGTAIGNPWTFPFIFVLIFQIGAWVSGASPDVPLEEILDSERLWGNPFQTLEPVLTPMIHGGFIVAPIMWWVTFVLSRVLVEKYQVRRAERIRQKQAELTGDQEFVPDQDETEDDRT